jgi:hypothetical protein
MLNLSISVDGPKRSKNLRQTSTRILRCSTASCMPDVKKFPRARGWGLCSGIEQIWEEHVLDGEATLR